MPVILGGSRLRGTATDKLLLTGDQSDLSTWTAYVDSDLSKYDHGSPGDYVYYFNDVIRTEDGTLWAVAGDQGGSERFWYSTDDGATWIVGSTTIAISTNIATATEGHTPNQVIAVGPGPQAPNGWHVSDPTLSRTTFSVAGSFKVDAAAVAWGDGTSGERYVVCGVQGILGVSPGTPGVWYHTAPYSGSWTAGSITGGSGSPVGIVWDSVNAEWAMVSATDAWSSVDGASFSAGASGMSGNRGLAVGNGIVLAFGTNLYVSTDAGASFTLMDTIGTVYDARWDGTRFYAVTETELWSSDENGDNWTLEFTVTSGDKLRSVFAWQAQGHGFFRYPLYWDQINGEATR